MHPDEKLCYCFRISKRKIVNFVRRERPRRASQISECFGAGTGCGWCIPFLKKIHAEIIGGEALEAGDISPSEYEAARQVYISEVKEGRRQRNSLKEPAAGSEAYFSRPAVEDPEPETLA